MAAARPLKAAVCCVLIGLMLHLDIADGQAAITCPGGNYGPGCSLSCAERCDQEANCVNSTVSGGCTVSCQKGWEGFPLCNDTCRPNWFSYNCSLQCHCRNITNGCDSKNGNCQSGCQNDWAESSCHVRMPVLTTPPWIIGAGCGSFRVAFRPFNDSVDIGAGWVALYQIESAVEGQGNWRERANVTITGPYQALIDVGSTNQTLRHRFRVRILYRSDSFYERLAPAGNQSEPGVVSCEETTPGTSTTTASTTTSPTTSGSTAASSENTLTSMLTESSETSVVTSAGDTTPTNARVSTATSDASTPPDTTQTTSVAPLPPDNTAVIVTLCVLLFLALCIALALLLYWLRTRRAKAKKSLKDQVAMGTMAGGAESISLAEPRSARYWTGISELLEPRRPVLNSLLASTLKIPAGVLSFQAEYDSLPRGHKPQRTCEAARRLENAAKNATPLCLPYDYNRVTFNEGENVYYNASIVKGYVRRDAYIAAQSPTGAGAAELFWRAVLEQNVAQVVAAGGSHEPVVFRYWPDSVGQTLNFGSVSVLCESSQRRHEFTVHRLRVNGMRVTHYQLVCRPTETLGLVAMYTAVRTAARIEDGPMLVHCRTGIGSTCVFIALDWLLQQAAQENGAVGVCKCVRELRLGRPNALPDARQYALLYDALFEAFLRCGFLAVPAINAIDAFLVAFDRTIPSSSTTHLAEQLRVLTQLGPILSDPISKTQTSDANCIAFDSHQEAGVILYNSPPVCAKLDDDAAVATTRNAFWLEVLRRHAVAVACLDSSAAETAAVLPAAPLAADNGNQETLLELPGLQILFPASSNESASAAAATGNHGCKRRTLSLRPRRQNSTPVPVVEAATKVELLMLSWAAARTATIDNENFDEVEIVGLANAVAALTTADTPSLLVDSNVRRCGILALALQAWRQLVEDGYADICAAVRRYQRQCGVILDTREYRLILCCLQRLAIWRRRRSLPKSQRKSRRRHGGNTEELYEDDDSVWRGLTSTLESSGDELERSIYDYCQLPVVPRADLTASTVVTQ